MSEAGRLIKLVEADKRDPHGAYTCSTCGKYDLQNTSYCSHCDKVHCNDHDCGNTECGTSGCKHKPGARSLMHKKCKVCGASFGTSLKGVTCCGAHRKSEDDPRYR